MQLLYHVSLNYFFTLVIEVFMHSMCQTIHSLCKRAETILIICWYLNTDPVLQFLHFHGSH